MRQKKQLISKEFIHWRRFMKLTGLTHRQIQWADETRTLPATMLRGYGGAGGKTRFYYREKVKLGKRLALIARHSPHSAAARKKLILLDFKKVVRIKQPIVINGTLYTR